PDVRRLQRARGYAMTVTLTTAASPNVTLSASRVTLSDSATLSGGSNPTGDIVFTLTEPGGSTFTETVTVNGNGTYTIPTSFTLPKGTVPGTYVWHVLYSGDGDNNTATANLENVTVGVNPS